MPGRYKPASEYKKKFRWQDSIKSPSFISNKEQNTSSKGLQSAVIGHVTKDILEPPLQRRAKPLDNYVKKTFTTSQFYSPPSISSEDNNLHHRKSPSRSRREDKHTTHRTSKSRSLRSELESQHASSSEPRLAATKVLTKNNRTTKASSHKDIPQNDKHKTYSKLTNGQASSPRPTNGHLPADAVAKPKDGHRSSNESGKSSRKPHDVDAALQYQAGIKVRPLGPRYLSEYQRQFEWKHTHKESPLIAADELIHRSNANIAPFDPSKIHKKTEYDTQFKAYHPPAPSIQQQLQENVDREMKARYKVNTKSKRNKRLQLSPDEQQMKTAGVSSADVHNDPKVVKSSQNPQKPFFTHASVRKWNSEYHSNFKSPSLFTYEDGIWKGANPSHLHPRDEDNPEADNQNPKLRHTKSEGDIPSWFAEVLELRNRAHEYQRRAHGTHFGRDHLAQLLANDVKLWEESSTGVSTSSLTSSLSGTDAQDGHHQIGGQVSNKLPERTEQETHDGSRQKSQERSSGPSARTHISPSLPVRSRLAWNGPDKTHSSPSLPVRHRLAWNGQDKESMTVAADHDRRSSYGSISTPDGYKGSISDSSEGMSTLSGEGRLPTPKLQHQRHHLDKTTPSSGGALLISPPRRQTKDVPRRHMTAPAVTGWTENEHRPQMTHHQTSTGHHGRAAVQEKAGQNQTKTAADINKLRTKAVIPGGTSKTYLYDSDEDDDIHDKILAPSTTPRSTQPARKVSPTSPIAGMRTVDTHQLSRGPSLPFQRHSNHFFETSRSMPIMPGKIEPPKMLAAVPRSTRERILPSDEVNNNNDSGSHKNRNAVDYNTHVYQKGPLNRPSSGSVYGRPQTAYPQTRQNAAREASRRLSMEERPSPCVSPDLSPDPPDDHSHHDVNHFGDHRSIPSYVQEDDELSLSTLSTRSNISLASEVLERAKKRKDDFWGKKV